MTVSYLRQADKNYLSGAPTLGELNPINDEFKHQIEMNMQQMAIDAEYTFLQGAVDIDEWNEMRTEDATKMVVWLKGKMA